MARAVRRPMTGCRDRAVLNEGTRQAIISTSFRADCAHFFQISTSGDCCHRAHAFRLLAQLMLSRREGKVNLRPGLVADA
jgi:hypothetical protein